MLKWLGNLLAGSMAKAVEESPLIPKAYVPNDDLLTDFDRQAINILMLDPQGVGLRPGMMAHPKIGVFEQVKGEQRMRAVFVDEYHFDSHKKHYNSNYRELSEEGEKRLYVEWRRLMTNAVPEGAQAFPVLAESDTQSVHAPLTGKNQAVAVDAFRQRAAGQLGQYLGQLQPTSTAAKARLAAQQDALMRDYGSSPDLLQNGSILGKLKASGTG